VTSSNLIIDIHYGWPAVALSINEDALWPYYRKFEDTFAAYCLADESIDALRRFHAALHTTSRANCSEFPRQHRADRPRTPGAGW
jgi:hypothetical protein